MGKPHLTTTLFSSLDLHDSLKESLEDNGYEFCTLIQEKSLPRLLIGKDVTGQAQTGTGKTAAFLLATLNHLMTVPLDEDKQGPFAIIMAPTRELAVQIYEDAKMLGAYTGLNFALLYGGTGYTRQKSELDNHPDVVIGTVGRILDFYKQRQLHLGDIEVLVLDEADRMFDLGFINDIRYLMRKMPSADKRRNMLFSATFSQRVLELAYEHMNDPEMVKIETDQITADRIEQSLYHVSVDEKLPLLFGLLKKETPERSIIFVNTKRTADELYEYLIANDYKAAVLSGDIPQHRRESLLEEFKEGVLSIMVATDVAARGLHIEGVTHVINYDLPQDVEDYVHRIGRTARAGAAGKAISLACEEYVYSLMDIESYIKMQIPSELVTDELLASPKKPVRHRKSAQRSRNTERNGRKNIQPEAYKNEEAPPLSVEPIDNITSEFEETMVANAYEEPSEVIISEGESEGISEDGDEPKVRRDPRRGNLRNRHRLQSRKPSGTTTAMAKSEEENMSGEIKKKPTRRPRRRPAQKPVENQMDE